MQVFHLINLIIFVVATQKKKTKQNKFKKCKKKKIINKIKKGPKYFLETSEEPEKSWNVAWCGGGEQKERSYGKPWNVCTSCGEDQEGADRARG